MRAPGGERCFISLEVNGNQEELSTTVAALLALEDRGLCVVTLAMKAEDPRRFVLMPGQAATALAIGIRLRQQEEKRPVEAVDAIRDRLILAARKRTQGTTLLALAGTSYIASLQTDMAESLEGTEDAGPKA